MLPDFTKTRKKLDEIAVMQISAGVHHSMGVLNQIRFKITREGKANRLVREDGSAEEIESRKMKVEVTVPIQEAENWTVVQSAQKLAEMSIEMARQKESFVFEKLHEVTEKVGNVVDAKGNYNEEHYFEMLRKIHLDFNSNGMPRMPEIAGGARDKVLAVESRIHADPKLREQLAEIIQQKREEWCAREANRTLVG